MPKLRSNGRLQSRLHDILVKSSSRYAHPIVAVTKPIDDMIDRLIKNARGAAAVFMTEDRRAARQLLGEKEVFREIEARTTEEYFGRTRGRAETIEMSKLFLDSCATSSGSTLIWRPPPIRCSKGAVNCCQAG